MRAILRFYKIILSYFNNILYGSSLQTIEKIESNSNKNEFKPSQIYLVCMHVVMLTYTK